MWSDPDDIEGWSVSNRGAGINFKNEMCFFNSISFMKLLIFNSFEYFYKSKFF